MFVKMRLCPSLTQTWSNRKYDNNHQQLLVYDSKVNQEKTSVPAQYRFLCIGFLFLCVGLYLVIPSLSPCCVTLSWRAGWCEDVSGVAGLPLWIIGIAAF